VCDELSGFSAQLAANLQAAKKSDTLGTIILDIILPTG